MLKSIGLENYKCFKNETEIGIAPLTVLCGVNSSGKSSILKSLLMLKQSYEDKEATNFLTFNGKYIDNGSFSEILNEESDNKYFKVSNSFEIAQNANAITKDLTSLRDLRRLYYDNRIQKFVINYSISVINGDDSVYANKISKIDINIDVYKNNNIAFSSIVRLDKNKNKYNIEFKNVPDVSGKLGTDSMNSCICYFSGISLNSIYQEFMDTDVKLFIPAITSIFNIVSIQYLQIRYIAPLRENPKRRYIVDKNVNSVGVSGENAPLLLNKVLHKDWWGITAPISEDNYENLIKSKEFTNFGYILNTWMKYFELGELKLDKRQKDIVKVKINGHNISDVGFGVSQSLPILIEGIFMKPEQTLLLEQPEIHLHPKMQMRMADFLLSLAKQDKQIVVETHSDHFINRLVRRIIEDDSRSLKDSIAIYFIEQEDNSFSKIRKVNISDENGIIDWPDGFFDQFANEQLKIMQSGILKRQKIKERIL